MQSRRSPSDRSGGILRRNAIRAFRIGPCVTRQAFSSRLGSLLRLTRAGFVLARAGVFRDVDPSIFPAARPPSPWPDSLPFAARELPGPRPPAKGNRTRQSPRGDQPAGPSYVKLGQFLATRPDVVGRGRRPAARASAGPDGAFSARGRGRDHRGRLRRTARPHLYRLRRAARRRLDCPGSPSARARRRWRTRRRR